MFSLPSSGPSGFTKKFTHARPAPTHLPHHIRKNKNRNIVPWIKDNSPWPGIGSRRADASRDTGPHRLLLSFWKKEEWKTFFLHKNLGNKEKEGYYSFCNLVFFLPLSLSSLSVSLSLRLTDDVRFPEMFRPLFNQGAEIISIPSAFTGFLKKTYLVSKAMNKKNSIMFLHVVVVN